MPLQLTKEQLVSVLPLLLSRLDSQDVVVYTYAAVALDRILSMRVGDSTILMYVFLASYWPHLSFLFTASIGFHLRMFSLSPFNS
jgi:Cse1